MPSPSSRRPPLASVLAALLPILLVAGLYLGGHPEDLPRFMRQAFVKNGQGGVVDEAIARIARDYYRPIPPEHLTNASISGMVASLRDRFSHYLAPSEYREFNSPPHFAGIGVVVDPGKRGLLIGRVFDSSPASRAALKPGDLIVGVSGKSLLGVNADAATALIKGKPGTDVVLQIEAGTPPHRKTPHGQADPRDGLRAGRRVGLQDGRRSQARRGRAGHVQRRGARRSARSRRTSSCTAARGASSSTCAPTAAVSSRRHS